MQSIPEQLGRLDQQCSTRTLRLLTRNRAALELCALPHQVQGITRIDRGDRATLALSVAGAQHGQLWLAEFDLIRDEARPGTRKLAQEGRVVSVVSTGLPHPGGLQAAGHLLAVPCQAASGWARIEIFDIGTPSRPRLVDSLTLDGSLDEGASQRGGSKAGFLLFGALARDEYLMFVGGRSQAESEGWFYRYTPHVDPAWSFEGCFAGAPSSSVEDAWGPQHAAAFVDSAADGRPYLITLGTQVSPGDGLMPLLRVFSLERTPGRRFGLLHEPAPAPKTYRLRDAQLMNFLRQSARWGSTAFADAQGELWFYFTAHTLEPCTHATASDGQPSRPVDLVHELQICELRAG